MSIVHSCEASQYASRVTGGWPRSGRTRQPASADGRRARDAARQRLVGQLDALRGEQPRHELAEHDRLAVGDEVDAAGRALGGPEPQALDDVVDVRRRRAVPAAADPRPAAFLGSRADAGHDRRVARAPHQPRPDDDRLDALRGEHGLLGLRLGGAVERLRARLQRRALVDHHERLAVHQRGLGADVDEAPHAGLARWRPARCACRRRCRARTPPACPSRRGARRRGT